LGYAERMKTFRVVSGILAILPFALLVQQILAQPGHYGEDSLQQMAFVVLGVPILILNLWAWMYPRGTEVFALGGQGKDL
jgi:hypothetical protein